MPSQPRLIRVSLLDHPAAPSVHAARAPVRVENETWSALRPVSAHRGPGGDWLSLLLLAAHFTGLAGFAADHFFGVLNAFPLVRLRLANPTDVGGHLADQLLIGPPHAESRRAVHREADPLGRVHLHRM